MEKRLEQIKVLDIPKEQRAMRLPTAEEWEQLMDIVNEDDRIAHWFGMYSWLSDETASTIPLRTQLTGGFSAAREMPKGQADYNLGSHGFRPVIMAPRNCRLKDGEIAIIGTLYMNGTPVRVPTKPYMNGSVSRLSPLYDFLEGKPLDGNVTPYVRKATLSLGDAAEQNCYKVQAIKVGDILIADRNLLCQISARELEEALPATDAEIVRRLRRDGYDSAAELIARLNMDYYTLATQRSCQNI